MRWITRERPKIDRIACPWLIKRFVDKEAEIIYVPFEEVMDQSKKLNATPFDIPCVEFTHYVLIHRDIIYSYYYGRGLPDSIRNM